jgi:nicotinamidase-related amidase
MDTPALLIIDQQKGIDHPKLGKRNNPDAEAIILALLTHWRERGSRVVHIKHRSSEPNSVFWPFQEGFDFKPDFEPVDGEIVIEKPTPCAFTGTGLESLLVQWQVGCVVIAGVATNNSVEATARTAGCRGFTTYVVEDACFAFAKTDYYGNPRSADEVHAMSLANLEGEYATVINSRRLFASSTKI